MLLQCLTQMLCVEVGIYLCCEDTLVTEQLLYLTDACATLQQMRCKGVTEGVGANLLCYACTQARLLDDGEDHHTRKFSSAIIQKECILLASKLLPPIEV